MAARKEGEERCGGEEERGGEGEDKRGGRGGEGEDKRGGGEGRERTVHRVEGCSYV